MIGDVIKALLSLLCNKNDVKLIALIKNLGDLVDSIISTVQKLLNLLLGCTDPLVSCILDIVLGLLAVIVSIVIVILNSVLCLLKSLLSLVLNGPPVLCKTLTSIIQLLVDVISGILGCVNDLLKKLDFDDVCSCVSFLQ